MQTKRKFETLCKKAVGCRCCFLNTCSKLEAANIDIAQPRSVGPRYWSTSQRVLIITINPGAGKGDSADQAARNLIRAFHNGTGSLTSIFTHQKESMANWGRFLPFYTEGLDLKPNEIAFANIAWCATKDNKYPSWMLRRCYKKHTERLLRILDPNIVLLSGTPTHEFTADVQSTLPHATVIRTLHYKHRKGGRAERRELSQVRRQIVRISDA